MAFRAWQLPISTSVIRLLVLTTAASTLWSCAPRRTRDVATTQAAQTSSPAEPQLSAALETKLASQFERFRTARARILEVVGKQGGTMGRQDWEALLAPPPTDPSAAFSPADLAELRRFHDDTVRAAQIRAEQTSALDLGKIRQAQKVEAFCTAIPKGGMLHIHPYGTLDEATATKILNAVNPVIGPSQLANQLKTPGTPQGILYDQELTYLRELGQRVGENTRYRSLPAADKARILQLFFLPKGSHSFDRFNGVFTVISKLVFSNNQVKPDPMMFDGFFRRAAKQGLDYVEITNFTGLDDQWFHDRQAWANEVKQKYGITARLLAAFNRTKAPAVTRSKTKELLNRPETPIIVGVNLLADETNAPALEAGQTLYATVTAAAEQGTTTLHRTIHAGELGDVRNVRDALLMGAERIGHGVKLAEDTVTVDYMRRNRIPVEANLLSNQRLKVVDDLRKHPFLRYARLGIPVSLSTDDEGIFGTTISSECVAAVTNSDITYDELKTMFFNGILTSFATPEEKEALQQTLKQRYSAFETAWQAYARQSAASPPSFNPM